LIFVFLPLKNMWKALNVPRPQTPSFSQPTLASWGNHQRLTGFHER
jgi:hypothetical protein